MVGLRGTLGLSAALLVAGGAFEVPPLSVAGAALALLAFGVGGWVALAAQGASISRTLLPPRVVEGESFPLRYTVRGGLLPLPGRIADPLLDATLAIGVLRPLREAEPRGTGSLARRGRHRLPAPDLLLADPLQLGSAVRGGKREDSILVLPRIEPVLSPSGGQGPSAVALRRGAGDLAASGLRDNPSDPELDGLRPYRRGSSASRIYWPALARTGELVERRLTSGGGAAPLVVLDSTGAGAGEPLDRAVRAAASLCLHLGRDGGCELLLVGSPRRLAIDPDLVAWPDIHGRLAMVEGGGPLPLRDLPREGTIFWVTPTAPRGRGGPARGYLICAEPLRAAIPAFTVAGCSGYPARPGARGALAVSATAETGGVAS